MRVHLAVNVLTDSGMNMFTLTPLLSLALSRHILGKHAASTAPVRMSEREKRKAYASHRYVLSRVPAVDYLFLRMYALLKLYFN